MYFLFVFAWVAKVHLSLIVILIFQTASLAKMNGIFPFLFFFTASFRCLGSGGGGRLRLSNEVVILAQDWQMLLQYALQ